MRILIVVAVIVALAGQEVVATTVYRCETDRGVIFSEIHCGEGAVKLSSENPEQPRFQPTDGSKIILPAPRLETFERLSSATAEQIVRQAGHPAARYTYEGVEHWLYPSVTRNGGGRVRSPKIYLESEYRRSLTRDGLWGAVVFLNGVATTRPATGTFGRMDPGVGAGLRVKFNKNSDSNLW